MPRQKIILISVLSLSFLLAAVPAFAAMTFSSDAITGDGIIKLGPGTDAFIQLGPDTYGVDGWDGYTVGTEIYRTAATNTDLYELFIDTSVGDIASATGTGINVDVNTQGAGAANNVTSLDAVAGTATSYLPVGRTTAELTGGNFQAYAEGGGTVTNGTGIFTQVDAEVGSTIENGYGFNTWLYDLSPNNDTSNGYAYYADWLNGNTMSGAYGVWVGDMGGVATNPYYSWYDSQGVGRCREDNTFNSLGQSICAVYNPQFTKYTPGAANYERIVYGQWNSNVAEIGVEKGGTGTLRGIRILGDYVEIPGADGDDLYVDAISGYTSGDILLDVDNANVAGAVNALSYKVGGTAGLSVVKTIKGSDGANCTMTFVSGLLTATTCP